MYKDIKVFSFLISQSIRTGGNKAEEIGLRYKKQGARVEEIFMTFDCFSEEWHFLGLSNQAHLPDVANKRRQRLMDLNFSTTHRRPNYILHDLYPSATLFPTPLTMYICDPVIYDRHFHARTHVVLFILILINYRPSLCTFHTSCLFLCRLNRIASVINSAILTEHGRVCAHSAVRVQVNL